MGILNLTKIWLLTSLILLTDFYVVAPGCRLLLLSIVAVLATYLLFANPVIFSKQILLHEDTRRVLTVAALFLLYMLVSNIVKNKNLDSLPGIVTNLIILGMLPIFEFHQEKFALFRWYLLLITFSIGFAVLQSEGFAQNLGTLFPDLGIIKSDNFIDPATSSGERASGASSNIVLFAEFLGILVIYFYYRYLSTRDFLFPFVIVIAIAMLFLTQVRAAIYALFPAVIFGQLLCKNIQLHGLVKMLVVILLVASALFSLGDYVTSRFTYLTKEVDSGDTNRFEVNLVMAKGVLQEAPIFGISKEEAWGLLESYDEEIAFRNTADSDSTPTHHNQIGYYFRYYGFAGLAMLFWLYYAIYKKICSSSFFSIRMFLLSVFAFDFIYSLGHNNKVISTVILWILLSLASSSIDVFRYRKIPKVGATSE